MAGAEPEPGEVGGSGSTLPGRSHGTVRLAPLDPEQLQRVLKQVTRAQPPPSVLSDAGRRLPDGARQTAQQRGPGAEAPRLLTPQVRCRARWRGRSWPVRPAFGALVVYAQLRGNGAVTYSERPAPLGDILLSLRSALLRAPPRLAPPAPCPSVSIYGALKVCQVLH